MPHFTRDYSKSPAPAFDAVEDIRDYLGDQYAEKAAIVRQVTDAYQFTNLVGMFLGIEGRPVEAWYEHFHGQGTFKPSYQKGVAEAMDRARAQGRADGRVKVIYQTREVQEAYITGIEEGKANG